MASEPSDLDLARHLMTDALLRGPRRPHRAARHLHGSDVPTELRSWSAEIGPVTGVATTVGDAHAEIVVLTETETTLDAGRLGHVLGVRYPIRTVVSGPILPAARPAQGGDSLSGDGPGGETGTLACVVQKTANDLFVLGCNHTLAGVNRCTVNQDTVRQPGVHDGGQTPGDTLGTLVSYQTIMLGGYHPNTVDAAIAEPHNDADLASGIRKVGAINGVGPALNYGDRVHKVGWKSGHTYGTYRYKLAYTTNFDGVGDALFVDQYGIVGDDPSAGFAQQGDSGAAVLTEDGDELVAMVIGIADQMNLAMASPIEPVLSTFGVTPA